MLGQATAVGFISATDEGRARAFYEGVLGLEVGKDQFALIARVGETALRITTLPEFKPLDSPVFGFQVADLSAVVAALTAKGVAWERYAFLGDSQGEDGVWTGPDGSRVAWFKDPDGNLLTLTTPTG